MVPGSGGHDLTEAHRGARHVVLRGARVGGDAVVWKTVAPGHPCAPAARAALQREHDLLVRLDVPGTARPLGMVTLDDRPALVLVDAGPLNLKEWLGRRAMPADLFLTLALQLTETLAQIHEARVLHRDLNPTNIVVGPGERLTLVDFAAATVLDGTGVPAHPAGSLPYMAPEETGRMNRLVDARADLYSLGATFYEMLTGGPPFTASDPLAAVHAQLAQAPVPPARSNPALPSILSDIILKLLAKTPEERYQSARSLLADLRTAVERTHGECIAGFELGLLDQARALPLPERLYGRETPLAALHAAWERAAAGGREVVSVEGPAGVGKSALVQELARAVEQRGGWLLRGKFDAHVSQIPFAPLAEAFRDRVRALAAQPAPERQRWRERLAGALGGNAAVITEVLPELESLLGPQPPVPTLGSMETENRFLLAFEAFVRALAAPEQPLLLFLDDLQWADPASLKLFRSLGTVAQLQHLLLVGARRPDEAPAHAPDPGAAPAQRLVLEPLPLESVLALCCDTLRCGPERGRPLAELIAARTAGNPFFVGRLLRYLHRCEALRFDADLDTWTWELPRVRAVAVTDNVVELLLSALRRLPARTQELLQVAAGMGHRVPLRQLAVACGRAPEATAAAAWSAVVEGLLVLLDDEPTRPESSFQFAHDRVRQAAYALLDEPRRPAAHLAVGRRLWRDAGTPVPDESLFLIAGQLNRGAALITDPSERLALAELNLRAATRARQASAFAQALTYARHGIALLPAEAWREHHRLAFALHRHGLECAHVTGDPALAGELLATALAGTEELAQKAELYDLEVTACTARLDPPEALRKGLEGLRLFGIEPPDPRGLAEELAAVQRSLGGRTPDQVLEAPLMKDPDQLACLRLLVRVTMPAFSVRQEVWTFLTARTVRLSLQHGNSLYSPVGYMSWAILVQRTTGDHAAGHAWGRMAVALSQRLGDAGVEARIAATFAAVVNDWCAPIRTSVALVQRAGPAGIAAGELLYGTGCYTTALILRHHQGIELTRLFAEVESALPLARRTNVSSEIDAQLCLRQTIRCLQGLTRARNSFDDAEFDEADYLARASTSMRTALHTIRRLETSYLLGDLPKARALFEAGKEVLPFVRAFVLSVEHAFYGALTLAAACAQAPPEERDRLIEAITAERDRLARWAVSCPENYRAKQLLVEAELLRLRGQTERAGVLYDEGIEAAARDGFLRDEAVGSELAGRMYRELGRKRLSGWYLSAALEAYTRWGAHAKARALHEELPELAPLAPPVPLAPVDPNALDLLTLSRAAEAIASELVLDPLLEKLVQVCLATAGAQRGAMLLDEQGQLYLRAVGRASEPVSLQRTPLDACQALVPVSVVRSVHKNDETVVIGDASRPGQGGYPDEPYLHDRGVRSVLALPVRRQGRRVGVLYLENSLSSQVFTLDRVQVLQLLSSHIATSLQISQLFEGLTHEIDERKRAEAAGRFLSEAGVALAGSLDDQTTLALVARLPLGFLADGCLVDLFEEGKARRMAAAHIDPAKEKLLERVRELQDQRRPPPQALEVRAQGRAVVVPELSEATLRDSVSDPEALRLTREIGVGSSLILPLRAHERLLGTMTLFSAPGGRRYSERDLPLGEELARRAAVAIDNARLYRETSDAVRLRDEFLSIASHELNTPIAALQLSVEGLEQAARSSPPQVVERLSRLITRQSRRLGALVRGLLSVAELQAGRLKVERTTVDLAGVVRELAEELGPELARARCSLAVLAPAPVEGQWDRTRLAQIVTNLLSNAIKYGAGAPIHVSVDLPAPGMARLTVQDHGIGIDPTRLRHLFSRFERAVPATNYGGLGLGLYIVREIATALGGTVSATSKPGEGATFVVELPRGDR